MTADQISMLLAGLAVVAAVVVLPIYAWRSRRRTEQPTEQRDELPPPEPSARHVIAPDPGSAVHVRLVASPGVPADQFWRFTAPDGAPPTSVHVFSFKSRLDGDAAAWQHGLMDAPLPLVAGKPLHVKAPHGDAGDMYDVVIGWTIGDGGGRTQGSCLLTVAREEWE